METDASSRNGDLNGSRGHSRTGSDSSPRDSRRARSERTRSPDSRSGRYDDRRDRDRDHRDRKRRYHDDDYDSRRRRHSRSRSPPPSRRRRDDSRERDDDKRRSYDKDRDYDRGYRRRRSPSPVPRDRDRRRDGPRSPYRDSPRRGDDRSPPSRRYEERRSSPPRNDPEEPARDESPEPPEDEREMRTCFVSQISNKVDDRILANFFENVVNIGKVREARVIVDRISKRSKGVAYVEFKEAGHVGKAVAVTGTKLLGIPIKVEYTESEKNRMALASNTPSALQIPIGPGSDAHPNSSIPYNRLYIGSLNFNLGDKDLRDVFSPFGAIDMCELHMDEATGKSKGYGFVQYKKLADARVAFEKMNGFTLAGRQIRVGLNNDKGSAANSFRNEQSLEEGGGTTMNQLTRLELMSKLARGSGVEVAPSTAQVKTRVNVDALVTDLVLLKYLFTAEEAQEKGFEKELADDVRGEVEKSYGPVKEVWVDKSSEEGEVYLRFEHINDAVKSQTGLDRRFFGGNQIRASHVSDALFNIAKSQSH